MHLNLDICGSSGQARGKLQAALSVVSIQLNRRVHNIKLCILREVFSAKK